MVLVQDRIDCIDGILGILIEVHVVLLIDSLQLGVESANHHIAETVGLDPGPVVNLIGRDVFCVAGHIGRSESIGSLSAYHRHQLVILVRYGDERCSIT